MALATTAAALAGTSALAAYVEARFHIKKDLRTLFYVALADRQRVKAEQAKRATNWYYFEERYEKSPESSCIWSREGSYNTREVYEQGCRYAQWFLSKGVKPGDIVAVCLQNAPEMVFVWLGLWAIGCAPGLINYNLTGKPLVHSLKVSSAKLAIIDEEIKDSMLDVRDEVNNGLGMETFFLDDGLKREISSLPAIRPENKYRDGVKPTDPMCLLYTSGTTGAPKACVFPMARVFATYYLPTKVMGVTPEDRWYDCMPLYHGTGSVSAQMALFGGLTLCIGKKFSVTKFWEDIHDSRATWFTYVGETARYLLLMPPSSQDKENTLKGMWGNGLRPDVWIKFRDRFGIKYINEFFNSSEGVFALSVSAEGDYLATAVGHHGLPLRAMFNKLYVPVAVDIDSNALYRSPKTGFALRQPYSTGGEILVKVPSEAAFPGYFGNAESTSAKFERDVFEKGDIYYRSGDALRRDDDGRWFFLDRLGDTFRWKSENVSTAEVAEVLGRYPGVVEANVYGVLVPGHEGRAGCAAIYVEPSARSQFSFDDLVRHAKENLPSYAVPVFLRLVVSMTPSHNNKQNKTPLREEGADPRKLKEGGTGDKLFWTVRSGLGKNSSIIGVQPFGEDEWRRLEGGQVRL
ncbi:MAG: hypothetical protein M4579_001572 [Chaenotheca gracillima]|nr:MAG: hypothetical protein M4579_001572 [Chaenotheca gracillima]